MNDLHNVWGTLRPARLSRLQYPPERGREHLKYPAVCVLVDKRPVKVEYYEVAGHLIYRSNAILEWTRWG